MSSNNSNSNNTCGSAGQPNAKELRILKAVGLANVDMLCNPDLREQAAELYEHLAGWVEEEWDELATDAAIEHDEDPNDDDAADDHRQTDAVDDLLLVVVKALKVLGGVEDDAHR